MYLRRNEAFTRFRNAILLANVLGLIGYVVLPTAPPRMFPSLGFVNTLDNFGALNHGSGIINFAANPYAAMPSLHAADALIIGVVLATLVRRRVFKLLWLLWPAWVAFAVMATARVTFVRLCCRHGSGEAAQVDFNRGSFPDLAVDADMAPRLFHEAVNLAQAKAGALA